MKTAYKIMHWLLFISLMALIITSLSADFFFSKEAILKSFQFSLPAVNIQIPPAQQLFIARIERRNTWDWHFISGLIFSVMFLLMLSRKRNKTIISKKYQINMYLFYVTAIVMSITGIWLYSRLFYQMSPVTFDILKQIHDLVKWILLLTVIAHISFIVHFENTSKPNIISSMFRTKPPTLLLIFFTSAVFCSINLYAKNLDSDRDKWLQDKDYVKGIMFLTGEKGAIELEKTIKNCPYAKCRKANITKGQLLNFVTIKIKKPNYRKAVVSLYISSRRGNMLANDKLLDFLLKQLNYKEYRPNKYLLTMLRKNVGLTFEKYKRLIFFLLNNAKNSNKSCISTYQIGEFFFNGYLGYPVNKQEAVKYYEKAKNICPKNNIYYLLSTAKVKK